MQVPKFKEFITETDIGRRDKPITVAMVTVADSKDPKENTTADLIQKACKKKGIKCVIVNTNSTIITAKDEDKGTLTVYNYDGKNSEHTFVGRDTCCIVRGGALENEAGLSLISSFQNSQAFMMNTRASMLTCDNKLTTALLFEKFGLPMPKTAFISNENNIKSGLDMIGGKFPVILKTLTGTQGVGVIKIESYEGLVATVQAMWKLEAELLIQEFMPSDFDIRTFVVDNKIFASTKRTHSSYDFRSNKHRLLRSN